MLSAILVNKDDHYQLYIFIITAVHLLMYLYYVMR